jgi:hypothetical protein
MNIKHSKGLTFLSGITADQIKGMLESRHSKDVFFTECKNGATWTNPHLLKLDAWILKRSYSPLTTIGYEIKVDRQDFENDQKWVDYLPLCHQFFFVCPAGMIRSDELPDKVGLMWVSTTGKLHTKRIAERRQPDNDKLNALLIYILMSRFDEQQKPEPDRTSYKRKFVEECNAKKELAYFVKGHIQDIQKYLNERELSLTGRENRVTRFATALSNIGITWNPDNNEWQDSQRVENEINALKGHIDNFTLRNMKDAGERILKVVQEIEAMRGIKHDEAKTTDVGTN